MYRRKNKIIYIAIAIVLVVGISIGYALLNSTLTINSTSKIEKNAWIVHFENIFVKEGSVEPIVEPTISNDTTISNFELILDKPGDFYEFYVDVVNEGTIDAMINSVVKTPDLTEEQKKYINYTIEYQNGEQIAKNQLVSKYSFVRLKVLVEYKKDLTASDLPTETNTLVLGLNLNLVQANSNGVIVENNGTLNNLINIVSGVGTNFGDKICIKDECFYVAYSDDETITLFAEYNLEVGNMKNENGELVPIENPSGLQSELTAELDDDGFSTYGTIAYSDSQYWVNSDGYISSIYSDSIELAGDDFSLVYIYNNNSLLFPIFENYKTYLTTQGLNVKEIRPMKYADFDLVIRNIQNEIDSGKIFDEDIMQLFNITNSWFGTVISDQRDSIMVFTLGDFGFLPYTTNDKFGARPTIVISKSELYK